MPALATRQNTALSVTQKNIPISLTLLVILTILQTSKEERGFITSQVTKKMYVVLKVLKDLKQANVLTHTPKRSFKCSNLFAERNPFQDTHRGLSTMIHRHKPRNPFIRQRDPRF